MKKPIISIIIPTYNAEKYIEKCIDSLINQSFKDLEIIFVNDGSTDNSRKIISEYEKKYNYIKCIDKENEGQAIARNIAINEANGEYLTFVDSDDWVAPDMCEKMLETAKKEKADIVFATSFIKVENNIETEVKSFGNTEKDLMLKYLITQSGPCNKLVKKDLIIKNELFFPEIRAYEDIGIVPIWALYAKKLAHVDDSLYYYLMREGSTMKQIQYSPKLEAIFVSLTSLLDKFNVAKQKEIYQAEIEWIFIEHLLHSASLRFFCFSNYKENIGKVNHFISTNFPNWKRNKYYKKQNIKYKIICNLFYKEKFKILKLLLKN